MGHLVSADSGPGRDHVVGDDDISLGRVVAWPLVVGGGVLAIAWTAWHIASGMQAVDAISTSVSGLAAFALAVIGLAVAINLLVAAGAAFTRGHPKLLSLDWMVPLAAALGFGLGLAVWH